MPRQYDDLTKDELIRLLEARDRRDATKFGLVWETNEIEREQALNSDFVTLTLDPNLSVGTAPWRNLLIEGDNFDALRSLRAAFAGQVKCIYIDPPYNTGNRDFVYNDRFVEKEDLWRHSKWCEFIYRRLSLAKDLLREDGAIFVSIDDNEMPSLSLMMKRIFGEDNFVATCIWQKRYSRENREAIGDVHEYIVVYAKNLQAFKPTRGLIRLTPEQTQQYRNPNNDPRGPWTSVSLNAQGYRPNQMYPITAPNGRIHHPPEGRCWSLVQAEYEKLVQENRVYWGADGNGVPRMQRFLTEVDGLVPWTWWPHEEVGHTGEARNEVREWLDTQTAFDTPKPIRLMERILQIGSGPNDLVLDFFAGSGTTGHAVLNLNAREGGNRRFILVSNTEAQADAPDRNLCRDVCAKRLKRVLEGYRDHPPTNGDFAYLRCNRVPAGRLAEIDHGEVWTALQLMHIDTLAPYVDAPFLAAGEADSRLFYVPRVRSAGLASLRQALADCHGATLYSWQPELLRQRVGATHVQFEGVPESLTRRFGSRGGAR